MAAQVREELVSLTPNNAVLVGEVRATLAQEKLTEMLQEKKFDARQVQVARAAKRVRPLACFVKAALACCVSRVIHGVCCRSVFLFVLLALGKP